MIVSPEVYTNLFSQINDPNYFTKYPLIPEDEPIYRIDLNERSVETPKFVGVEGDYDAEIIWFRTDRFFGNIDLFESTIAILYTNADNKSYINLVSPMVITDNQTNSSDQTPSELYDAKSQLNLQADENGSETILIPWAISDKVAAKSGTLSFAFQFFKLSDDHKSFDYILNTKQANTTVLSTVTIQDTTGELIPEPSQLQEIYDMYSTLTKDYVLYWLDV